MRTFEEFYKLDAMDYTVRQITAMVDEGTSVQDALASIVTEIRMRRQNMASQLNGLAQLAMIQMEQDLEEVRKDL